MNFLDEVITGREKNYLLPFLWLHGAKESVLRNLMSKIDSSNIKEVCVRIGHTLILRASVVP